MSDPTDHKSMHWRRHDQLYVPPGDWEPGKMGSISWVPSACGRLVKYLQSTADPSEADCRECDDVQAGLGWVERERKQWAKRPNPSEKPKGDSVTDDTEAIQRLYDSEQAVHRGAVERSEKSGCAHSAHLNYQPCDDPQCVFRASTGSGP